MASVSFNFVRLSLKEVQCPYLTVNSTDTSNWEANLLLQPFAPEEVITSSSTKGQLISKCLLGAIVSTKKPTKILRISALASIKSSNEKTLLYKYVK